GDQYLRDQPAQSEESTEYKPVNSLWNRSSGKRGSDAGSDQNGLQPFGGLHQSGGNQSGNGRSRASTAGGRRKSADCPGGLIAYPVFRRRTGNPLFEQPGVSHQRPVGPEL